MHRIELSLKGSVNDTVSRELPDESVLAVFVKLKERFAELSDGGGSRRTRGRKSEAEEPSPESPASSEE